jgi:hypothetical protein
MPVNESASLENALKGDVGVAVDQVYLNGLYPERFEASEAKTLERAIDDSEGAARAAIRAALSEHRRADSQRDQLKRLKKRVSAPVKTLPFIFKPQLDVPDIERLAAAV